MHENELSWLNGGEHITVVPEISTPVSLGFIVVALALTTVLSLRKSKADAAKGEGPGATGGSGAGGGTEPRDAQVAEAATSQRASRATRTLLLIGALTVQELPTWFEVGSLVVLIGLLLADLAIVVRRPHVPSAKEAACGSPSTSASRWSSASSSC